MRWSFDENIGLLVRIYGALFWKIWGIFAGEAGLVCEKRAKRAPLHHGGAVNKEWGCAVYCEAFWREIQGSLSPDGGVVCKRYLEFGVCLGKRGRCNLLLEAARFKQSERVSSHPQE